MKVSLNLAAIAIAILLLLLPPALSSSFENNLAEINLSLINPDVECDSDTSYSRFNQFPSLTPTEQIKETLTIEYKGPLGLGTHSQILLREAEFHAKQVGDDPPALFYGGKKQGKALFKELNKLRTFWNFPDDRKVPMVALRGENVLDKERMMAYFLSLSPEDPDFAESRLAEYTTFLESNNYDPSNPLYTLNALAFFIPQLNNKPFEKGIVVGDGFLQYLLDDGSDLGKAAVEYVLAHEWGHENQHWRGLLEAQLSTPERSRFVELMADAFAGYFLHHPRGMSRQTKNIKDATEAAYNAGDCLFSTTQHHGTPLQRERTLKWAVSLVDKDPAGPGKAKILTADEFIAKFTEVYPSLVAPFGFDYPSKVSGSGDAGTSSFDVSFGYTGSYKAEAHGLVPATIRSGTVEENLYVFQDFPFLNAALESFDIPSGAKLFFAIPSVAIGNSIKMFSWKPNTGEGNPLNGLSFLATINGGLNNAIFKIPSPEEGQWNVLILSEQSNATYDLYSWILGPTGGTLSVVNAPESALTGQTETIEYMWEEVVSNELYYGFITHIGDDEAQLGITTIVVDNRNTAETIAVVSQISEVVEEPAHEQPTSSSSGMTNQVSVWAYAFMPAATMMMIMFQKWE